MKDRFVKNNLSDFETFILLFIFAVLVIIYAIFGVFQAEINSLIKLLPAFILGLYAYLKEKWNLKKRL